MALRAVSLPQTEQPQGGAQLGDIPSGLLGFFSATDPTISGLRPQFGTTSRFSNGPGGVGVRADGLSTGYVSLAKNLSPPGYTGTFFGLFRLLAGTDSVLLSTNNSIGEYTGHSFYCLPGGSVGVLMGAGGGASPGERRSLDSPSGIFTAGQLVAVAFAVDSSTTGRVWINGKQYSLTASGSGGAYAGGSSAGGIGVQRVTSYSAADVLAVGMWAPSLPNEVLQRWTTDPFGSLFAPGQIVVPVSAGGGAYTLTAEQGSYTLTGQAAALLAGRALAAAQGSYTLTGQDAALLKGNTLAADQGSYSLTGQDAALLRGLLLSAAQGSYALTGQDATLTYTPLGAFSLTADQGSYTLTGQSVSLLWGPVLAAGQGSYTLNGQDATLTYTPVGAYILTAGQGSYALTGQDVLLQWGHVLAAAQGSYTITGQAATLARGLVLAAAQGSYTLNGQAAAFARTYALSASYGSYTLTGQIVSLTYSGAALEALEYLLLISHITQSMSKTSKVTMEVDLISRIQQQLDGSSSI